MAAYLSSILPISKSTKDVSKQLLRPGADGSWEWGANLPGPASGSSCLPGGLECAWQGLRTTGYCMPQVRRCCSSYVSKLQCHLRLCYLRVRKTCVGMCAITAGLLPWLPPCSLTLARSSGR